MKTTYLRETHVCDACQKRQDYPAKCLRCGNEFCYDCQEKRGKNYNVGVFIHGTGDGFYCLPCDKILEHIGGDKLYRAYKAIAALSAEFKSWHKEFETRQGAAEIHLREMQK